MKVEEFNIFQFLEILNNSIIFDTKFKFEISFFFRKGTFQLQCILRFKKF